MSNIRFWVLPALSSRLKKFLPAHTASHNIKVNCIHSDRGCVYLKLKESIVMLENGCVFLLKSFLLESSFKKQVCVLVIHLPTVWISAICGCFEPLFVSTFMLWMLKEMIPSKDKFNKPATLDSGRSFISFSSKDRGGPLSKIYGNSSTWTFQSRIWFF